MDNETIEDIKSEIAAYMNLDYKIEELRQKKKSTVGFTATRIH